MKNILILINGINVDIKSGPVHGSVFVNQHVFDEWNKYAEAFAKKLSCDAFYVFWNDAFAADKLEFFKVASAGKQGCETQMGL